MDKYQVSNFIRHTTLDGRVIIIDLRQGQYLILDDVASYMWNALLSIPDPAQRIEQVAQNFDITTSECQRDMNNFIQNCKEKGLVVTNNIKPTPGGIVKLNYNSPNTLNAWFCLYLTRRSIKKVGFSVTYDLHSRMIKAETVNASEYPAILPTAIKAFQKAENFFSTRAAGIDCLPRSLALHRFLLSIGLDAKHFIGVRPYPFGAHAWVKVGEEVVCDTNPFVNKFSEIARL